MASLASTAPGRAAAPSPREACRRRQLFQRAARATGPFARAPRAPARGAARAASATARARLVDGRRLAARGRLVEARAAARHGRVAKEGRRLLARRRRLRHGEGVARRGEEHVNKRLLRACSRPFGRRRRGLRGAAAARCRAGGPVLAARGGAGCGRSSGSGRTALQKLQRVAQGAALSKVMDVSIVVKRGAVRAP